MNFKEKLKDLKVAKKLNVYRMCMIIIMIVMGIVSIMLSFLMNTSVKEITNVWQPSLSCVQELNSLTSDYRIKQYAHLVATDDATKDDFERQLEEVDAQITSVSASLQKLISTDTEQKQFDNISEKWENYKEHAEEVMELSRAGKTDEAGLLMVGEIYNIFTDFNESFDALETYENTELLAAEKMVSIVFIIMIVVIVVIVVVAVMLATGIGASIGESITEPLLQIEEAIVSMREGDFSKESILTYESEDELGVVQQKLRGSLLTLTAYVKEISHELEKMAKGDLTRDGEKITNFLGEFSSIKESLLYILKRFNKTLTEIQETSTHVAADSEEIANASQSLSEGAMDQAGAVEELTATVNTVSSLAIESAEANQRAYEQVRTSTDKAEEEKKKMNELTEQMNRIMEISKEIGDIITAIEDIASQTNLLSLNASIEAARAGEAGRGFAVVADQIGKLAADSARSAVNTRDLIVKILAEIEKGNATTISTSQSFEQIISDMREFAELAQQSMENAHAQADALAEVEKGIEQISGAVQNTAASSQENSAISVNLSEKSVELDELVKRFKLY